MLRCRCLKVGYAYCDQIIPYIHTAKLLFSSLEKRYIVFVLYNVCMVIDCYPRASSGYIT